MNIEGWRALKVFAVEKEATLNAQAVEAFNDLLKKHGKRPSSKTPCTIREPVHRPVKPNLLISAPYRADIDGLRAVSILLVVGYHAQPSLIPGGFIGVDIFFVISGFLISRLILTRAEKHAFSPAEFYSRRIRRIFPALIVVMAAVYLVGWFVLLPDGFSLLGKSIAAGVAFASNLFQLNQLDYFAPDATENPLLHLWSLGIEEQFYIFWPPVLWMIAGSKQRGFWIAVLAIASFALSLMIFWGYKESSFYSPIPRAWELIAGGFLANRQFVNGLGPNLPRGDSLLATAGLAMVIGAAFMLDKDSLFPGLYALLPVLGSVLIIASPRSWVNGILLSSRPMVLIGLISYPLYLWHWPLLSYLAILRNGVPNVLEIWLAVFAAVVLAWLTFRYVETPFRQKQNAVPQLSLGLLAIGAVGAITVVESGFALRFPLEIRDIATLTTNNAGFRDECFFQSAVPKPDVRCVDPGQMPLLFLWGDSTAAALYPGLKKAQETIPFRLAHLAAGGCAPILAAGAIPRCDQVNKEVFDLIKSSRPQIVLLHAAWDRGNNLDKLLETIRQLKAINARVIILGPVPVWKRTLPHSLVNFYRFRHSISDRLASGVAGGGDDERLAIFSRSSGTEFISAWKVLCNSDGCMTRVGPKASDVTTADHVHLSEAGSIFLIKAIEKSIFPSPTF